VLGGEVSLDGDGEGGKVLVADDLAELGLGFEHPGGRPTQPSCSNWRTRKWGSCGPESMNAWAFPKYATRLAALGLRAHVYASHRCSARE